MRRRNAGDDARRIGGLRINLERLGFLNVRRNLGKQSFSLFASDWKLAAVAGIEPVSPAAAA